ncbi:glycosyl hydrolase 43 family protein [Flavobacterium sufflavum]|uniref:Glycosyl hydrolase 43 family protein n=1 Tax=Flavobacterium sufflavum TaxID=1921138 RepID=A0A3S2V0R0_9FLAO|nr:glycoside hydrolase 43 family protein [Flavobacterium sufflavum]RVT71766.1 glycosyl hydrolase 43 family protein [Flavobacterium sufflavum]
MRKIKITSLLIISIIGSLYAQNDKKNVSEVWVSDLGNGNYKNPVLYADYSDPDVCRVGKDYYMTASSFNCIPGLPILHSNDLVNWSLVNYALPKQPPFEVYDKIQHGNGVWAPCIRYHKGEFYIFYPDPDFGIYMTKTKNPRGKWSEPVLVKSNKGIIDPAPFWDEDGKAYLGYALAGSRAGTKSVLMLCSMNAVATQANDDDIILFDGHEKHTTVEGPKFYKRNGYYYVFAPAGGVSTGWQLILRSKNILGPYEEKVVLEQGSTSINGPHQGAWVDTVTGEDWFLHFQDQGAYGRVVHLNPMSWKENWPVMGVDNDHNGIGEPVSEYKKPNVGATYSIATPPDSDEFNTPIQGLQWQWHANKQLVWGYPSAGMGYYRFNCIPKPNDFKSLWQVPNILAQKFPAEEFTATTKFEFKPNFDNEEFGFVVMGRSYSSLAVKQIKGQLKLLQLSGNKADKENAETSTELADLKSGTLYFRVKVQKGGKCQFYYSYDDKTYVKAGVEFTASEGTWIGSKIGYVALREGTINNAGYVNVDWFRMTKN